MSSPRREEGEMDGWREEEGERERGDGLKEGKREGRVRGVERVQKAVHREEEGERERGGGVKQRARERERRERGGERGGESAEAGCT